MPHPALETAAPRRAAFARLAGGVTTLFSVWALAAPEQAGAAPAPAWPGALTARHRLVVDAYEVNDGEPLGFAHTFVATNEPPVSACSVLVLRHNALPIALESAMWANYRIGESFKIVDPETKAPAIKNPYLRPKPGVLNSDAAALDRLLAAGVIVGACNVALKGMSAALAGKAGVSAKEAEQEWAANLVSGVALLASGVWAVGRAQEAGCGYCAGGG